MLPLIDIDVKGLKEVQESLDRIPPEAADAGVQRATLYLGGKLNGYYRAAPYNYLSWAQGGGGPYGGFVSQRQQRFVMASIQNGSINIPYSRTGGDPYEIEGEGVGASVISNRESMFWSMSPQGQTRMQAMRGWYNITVWLQQEAGAIVREFGEGVAQALIDIFGRG